MTIEIKHRYTDEVLYSSECDTLRDAVIEAIEKGANLRSADLSSANLRCANLSSADLRCAENILEADFAYSYGGNSTAQQIQLGEYQLTIIENVCWGGCTRKTLCEWLEYDGDALSEADRNYLNYVTKPFIMMVMAQRELGAIK